MPFLAWRILLVEHGATDPDHGLGMPDLATVTPLLRIFASHALDLRSWGLFWPIAAGVALSVVALALPLVVTGRGTTSL